MVRIELTADDSLAAMRARSKFGIAIAAMIRMIATTISNSISEKPFCFRILFFPLHLNESVGLTDPTAHYACIFRARAISHLARVVQGSSRFVSHGPQHLWSPKAILPKLIFKGQAMSDCVGLN